MQVYGLFLFLCKEILGRNDPKLAQMDWEYALKFFTSKTLLELFFEKSIVQILKKTKKGQKKAANYGRNRAYCQEQERVDRKTARNHGLKHTDDMQGRRSLSIYRSIVGYAPI